MKELRTLVAGAIQGLYSNYNKGLGEKRPRWK